MVLTLFNMCNRQFMPSFGGILSLVMTDVESAARALGIPWCEYVWVNMNVCADAVIEYSRVSKET